MTDERRPNAESDQEERQPRVNPKLIVTVKKGVVPTPRQDSDAAAPRRSKQAPRTPARSREE